MKPWPDALTTARRGLGQEQQETQQRCRPVRHSGLVATKRAAQDPPACLMFDSVSNTHLQVP